MTDRREPDNPARESPPYLAQLTQSLDMVPLAEGIETTGEFVFLRSNGCRLAQGFHFSRPVPADEIPALTTREGGLIPADASLLL